MSVSVSVNGGTPQYLNNPNTTLTIAANAGVDTFFFQTYDEADGEGSVLSQGNITQTIAAGNANFVNAVLDGVVNSVTLALDKPNAPAGTPATVNVTVNALDADGNVIVGAGGYDRSIKLAIDDPAESGSLTLSTTLVQGPSTPVTLNYNGATLDQADVSATASGLSTVVADFDPTPTAYVFSTGTIVPALVTGGPNGVMYFDDENTSLGSIDPTGTLHTAQSLGNDLGPIVFGSDGSVWYVEETQYKLGSVNAPLTQSSIMDYPISASVTANVNDMIDDHGTLVFTAENVSSIVSFVESTQQQVAYPISGGNEPVRYLALGSDDAIYSATTDSFYRLMPSGSMTPYLTTSASISGVASGPDGGIWFADLHGYIDRFTPGSTAVSFFPVPFFNSQPQRIVACGNALWFADAGTTSIARVSTTGSITEYPIPPPVGVGANHPNYLYDIACSSDGSLWLPDDNNNIVRFVH